MIAVEIQSLSKRYELGERESARQIREQLARIISPRKRKREREFIWALRDVSFGVPQGQVVGIIGRNGAGKSTLLKVLSRITYPTSGHVRVQGRVASLLEVGTGFHEELTGRENIYLNGSILGMRRRDIDRHFEAIVDFSGVEQFIDTPIKRFSSGMRLRLGFAVAAHLDPDVLIVDEVLAVGDSAFQKKCISAMEGLRSGGRTVLFVSHNMAAVENLCSRALWIDAGRLRLDGNAKEVIKAYLAGFGADESGGEELRAEGRTGTGELRFTRVELLTLEGDPASVIQSGDGLLIRMHFHAREPLSHPNFAVRLYTTMGTLIAELNAASYGTTIPPIESGDGHIDLQVDALNLVPGRYALMFYAASNRPQWRGMMWDGDVRVNLDVEASAAYGTARALDSRFGIVYFPHRWKIAGAGSDANGKPASEVQRRSGTASD